MKRRFISFLLVILTTVCTSGITVYAEESGSSIQTEQNEIQEIDTAIHPLTPEEEASDNPQYLQMPRVGGTKVYKYNTGGNTLENVLGCSRARILTVLGNHVNDDYYLGTPYSSGDHRNPNGDPAGYGTKDTAGVAGMNCTGFVWHVLTSAGGKNVPDISGWVTLLENQKVEYRTYVNTASFEDIIATILSDGYIAPGDIIWMWDGEVPITSTGLPHGLASSHHTGIYIGDYFDSMHTTGKNWASLSQGDTNRWWHSYRYSSSSGFSGNQTSQIFPITSCHAVTVIKASNQELGRYLDVPKGAWYYDYVEDVAEKGLMTGYDNGLFGATDILTRGQFATILYRMESSPEATFANSFPDVPDGIFYSLPIEWANTAGLITGYENGQFGPDDSLTREQLATIMYRYAQWKGDDISVEGDYTAFPDGGKVSEFAKEAMNWAIGNGIISGNADGTLAPQGKVSRAVCATIISRYLETEY